MFSLSFGRVGEVPILAVTAGEIAALGSKGKNRSAGQEMVERLFLYRVDAKSCCLAVSGQTHFAVQILPHETESPLAFTEAALPRAYLANYFSLVDMPPPGSVATFRFEHFVFDCALRKNRH